MKNIQGVLLMGCLAMIGLAGCGGSDKPTPPPAQAITVSMSGQPSSLGANATTALTATVANDSANAGVRWSASCGSSGACGSFNPAQSASGAATTYTAPAAVPSGNTVTVTATSVTDSTKTATATITITPPATAISVSLSGQPSSLVTSTTAALTATVANDSANAGVTWSATCGSSPACGTFSAATTPSGTATTYTAPAAVPSGNTVTVTATSVTDTSKTATATITITGAASAVLNDGTYVYHLNGQNANGQCFFAGAFTVVNGAIAGGKQDFSDSQAFYNDTIAAAGSSLSVAPSGNLQIVLVTGNQNIGPSNNAGTITLRGTKVSNARVLISEYDGYATGSGSMDLQTSTAAPSGGYAFVIDGFDLTVNNGNQVRTRLSLGGILNVSGTSVSANGSIFDYNLLGGGGPVLGLTFAPGTVSAPDQYGRVTFNLSPSTSAQVPGFILTGYIVGTNQIQLIESQQDDLSDNLAGMALGQGGNTGTFNAGSLAGSNYAFGTAGEDANFLVNFAGVLNFSSSLILSGPLAINDLTNSGEDTITGGSAAVDATGRVTISNVTTQHTPLGGNYGFQMYLDGNGNAMLMGADTVEVSAGQAYLRTGTPPRASGMYSITNGGCLNDQNGTPWSASGAVTVTSGSYTGFTDYNDGGTPTENVSLTGSLNTTTDIIALAGLDAVAFTTANNFLDYPIDNNRIVMLSIDPNLLDLMTMETVTK
jgi:ferredoxin